MVEGPNLFVKYAENPHQFIVNLEKEYRTKPGTLR